MRRPVDVKAHFRFLLSVSLFLFSQAASVAILPSALFGERYALIIHFPNLPSRLAQSVENVLPRLVIWRVSRGLRGGGARREVRGIKRKRGGALLVSATSA